MNRFKDWFFENWGNFFSFLGLIAAIYFGVFYVPNHIKKAASEKEIAIHNDILKSTKELIYSDSICTLTEVQNLISGKEVKNEIQYKYSLEQLLLQTQDAFMEHKFLPLQKRKALIEEIEILKGSIADNSSVNEPESSKSNFNRDTIQGVLSVLISIIAVFLGVISFWFKMRIEIAKTEEIENIVANEINVKNVNIRGSAFEYEKSIIETIKKELNIKDEGLDVDPNSEIDFKFNYKDKRNYVFVKYLTRSKIGLGTIQSFFYTLVGRKGNAIIVYNTDLTTMVLREAEKFKTHYPEMNVIFLKAQNSEEFKSKFKKEIIE